MIVANPVMTEAYKAGIAGNGKPFPDGSKIGKICVSWKYKYPNGRDSRKGDAVFLSPRRPQVIFTFIDTRVVHILACTILCVPIEPRALL